MTTNNVLLAAIGCPHVINDNSITLHFDGKQEGHNALNQLGRRLDAALQSQDREDAERYRWLRQNPYWPEENHIFDSEELDAAIDHARRAEGDGDAI